MNKNDIIIEFYNDVCKRAENKMLKTGKLEGAHYASMKEIVDEIKNTSDNSDHAKCEKCPDGVNCSGCVRFSKYCDKCNTV